MRSIAQAETRRLRGRNLVSRTPIRRPPLGSVCQYGKPSSVGLAPRVSLEALRPVRTFQREMCSIGRCYSSTQSRVPAASMNPGSIEVLANPVGPRGEAFHDALVLLRIDGRGSDRCERYLLEPTHPHQTSDTPVAQTEENRRLVLRRGASPFRSAETICATTS